MGEEGLAIPAVRDTTRRDPSISEARRTLEELGLNAAYDEMRAVIVVTGPLPWDLNAKSRNWNELDDAQLISLLEDCINLRTSSGADSGFQRCHRRNVRRPVERHHHGRPV